MLAALSVVGRLAWPFIGSLVPGLSPKAVMWFAGAFAVLVAIGGPAGAVWLKMRSERSAAVSLERAACDLSKAEDARISAVTMSDLLDRIAKAEEDDDGRTPAEKCKADVFCKRGKK